MKSILVIYVSLRLHGMIDFNYTPVSGWFIASIEQCALMIFSRNIQIPTTFRYSETVNYPVHINLQSYNVVYSLSTSSSIY